MFREKNIRKKTISKKVIRKKGHDTEGPKARLENGYFKKGSQHALGCKGRPYTQMNVNAFRAAVTPKEVTKIVRRLLKLCEDGDTKAIIYILDRCLGRTPFELDIKGEGQITFTLDMGKQLEEPEEPKQLEEKTIDIIDVVPTIIKETQKSEPKRTT